MDEELKEAITYGEPAPEGETKTENGETVFEPKKQHSGAKEEIRKLKEQLKQCEEQSDKLRDELKAANEKLLRSLADFDNYKKRNADLSSRSRTDGAQEVLGSVLPVLDNMERAADSVSDEKTKEGFLLIIRQFEDALKKLGVSEIDALGKPFDPNFHNAVMQAESDAESGTVTEVFAKGYMYKDKVLRYSMVKVAL